MKYSQKRKGNEHLCSLLVMRLNITDFRVLCICPNMEISLSMMNMARKSHKDTVKHYIVL